MKKFMVLIMCIAVVCCGCSQNNSLSYHQSISEHSVQDVILFSSESDLTEQYTVRDDDDLKRMPYEIPVDMSNSEDVYKKIVLPYAITGMLYSSWENESDLSVDCILNYYEFNVFFNSLAEKVPQPRIIAIPAEIVETVLTDAFPVSYEFLRTSELYNDSTQTYMFPHSAGVGYTAQDTITNIVQNEDVYTIYIESKISSETNLVMLDVTFNNDVISYMRSNCNKL